MDFEETDPEEKAKKGRQACNNPVQSSCADVLKLAMVKIYRVLRGGDYAGEPLHDSHILLTIHDEIVIEAKQGGAKEVAQIMKNCMEEAYEEVIKTVTNVVEVTIADYWKK